MKYVSYVSVLICLVILLGSCAQSNPSGADDTATSENIASAAVYLERLNYYRDVIEQYEDEIIELKKEMYISKYEYESRIEYLERTARSVGSTESPEGETAASLKGDDISSGSVPAQTSDETDAVSASTVPKSSDFRFIYTESNKTAVITEYIGTDSKVIIPETIDGYKVISLSDRAFDQKAFISEIVLPDSLESIGWFAFHGCTGLERISIPDSVKSIGYGVFDGCSSKLKIVCSSDSYAFRYAKSYGLCTE